MISETSTFKFSKNRFYGQWSSQRPLASVRVKQQFSQFYCCNCVSLRQHANIANEEHDEHPCLAVSLIQIDEEGVLSRCKLKKTKTLYRLYFSIKGRIKNKRNELKQVKKRYFGL